MQIAWASYLNGELEKGSFYVKTDLESHVEGRNSVVHRAWWTVDEVYVPICISSSHWVACAIHFHRRTITVYDSCPSAHSEQHLVEVMQPMSELLPYLLDDAGFYNIRTDLKFSKEAFTVVRPTDGIPLQQISGDCGVFTCMYIYYLGLNRPLDFSFLDGPFFRMRMAVELWTGHLL